MIVGGGRRHPRVDQLPELDTGPASLYVYVDGSRGLRHAIGGAGLVNGVVLSSRCPLVLQHERRPVVIRGLISAFGGCA
jgi:hypothetical protein